MHTIHFFLTGDPRFARAAIKLIVESKQCWEGNLYLQSLIPSKWGGRGKG
jgi:hypothetical protein